MQAPLILSLDNAGRPSDWLDWKEVVNLYVRQQIAWTGSTQTIRILGGWQHGSRQQSYIDINTIIAVRGAKSGKHRFDTPLLTNRALFQRDRHTCMYCGQSFKAALLTRDHIIPRAQKGPDNWKNVVTACKACNTKKACRTPADAHMPLLALPYAPNRAEAMILANRRILSDQMDFLRKHLPKDRREHFN